MSNTSFSSLVYRIIGKPERWHDDYIIESMQQYLDETDSFEDPSNLSELATADQIISRIKQGNVALTAFNTLLDQSRFRMIILDENLSPVYHNHAADDLFAFLMKPNDSQALKPELAALIHEAPVAGDKKNGMLALDYRDEHGDQIYLRTIQSQAHHSANPTLFYILMVLDKDRAHLELSPELVARYGLTKKEQSVLLLLMHGKRVGEIADATFTSEHTVRSHVRSILTKTNTQSQVAVISLMLTHESQVLDSYFESGITRTHANIASENDHEVTLAGGEVIAYCDYGPVDGRPLIVFHSGFGSRLAIPPNYREVCERTNRRLIIPDRPGLGKTPFIEGHPDRWNSQLQELIDLLGIQGYDVLGSIIACQMAVSYAAQADQRLNKLILTSPVVLNEHAHAAYLTEILAPAARYVRLSPQFAKEIYELWLKSVTLNLDAHYPSILDASIGSAERELFERENIVQLLTDVFKEGARQSLDGILNEMVFCMTPLGLDLANFTKPVEVWFGTEDKRITLEGVETIFKEFPNAQLHVREGYSEHLYYALFEEIIA